MKKITSILMFIFAILLSFNTLANPVGITGKVIDKDSGEALEYATITLFRAADSTFVAGIITDARGVFKLEAGVGKYFLTVQFMGYKTKRINVNVAEKDIEVNLGKIYIDPDTELLEEVEVVAEKSTMTMALDKRVFNVGKDISSTAGNAIDVLENIPSVTVDVEGNVSLRGDDGVQILVDGKAHS